MEKKVDIISVLGPNPYVFAESNSPKTETVLMNLITVTFLFWDIG